MSWTEACGRKERSGLGDVSPEEAGKREASRLRPQRESREPQQSERIEAGAAGRIPAAAGIGFEMYGELGGMRLFTLPADNDYNHFWRPYPTPLFMV